MENGDHTVPGETCVYVKRYTCANPGCTYAGDGTAASDTYVKHDYSIVDIVEATCVKEGTKTYKCACGAVNENVETISVNENHDWGTDGKCRNAGCSAAKVVATDNKVTANALTADTSLELKDKSGNAVALTMDEAALNTVAGGENANRELKISIDQVAVEDLQLDASRARKTRSVALCMTLPWSMPITSWIRCPISAARSLFPCLTPWLTMSLPTTSTYGTSMTTACSRALRVHTVTAMLPSPLSTSLTIPLPS